MAKQRPHLRTSNSKTSLNTIGVRGSTGGLDVVDEQSKAGKRPGSIVVLSDGELAVSSSDEEGPKPKGEEEKLLQRKYRLEKELQ